MTSIAIHQDLVDIALAAYYSGISIPTGDPPVSTPVRVFIETPNTEEERDRVFPSISIMYSGKIAAYTHYESEDFNEEEMSVDSGPLVPVRYMRQRPLPYNLLYMVHTWARGQAIEDRELGKEVFDFRTLPRWYLPAQTVDGNAVNLDTYVQGGVVPRDEELVDEVIYHKVQPLIIVAHLATAAFDDLRGEKVALESRSIFKNYKLLSSGEVVESKIDLTLKIDENGVERV